MSQSVLSREQFYEMNYGMKYEIQKDAADRLKKMGHSVREFPITLWIVNGEYISPDTMITRLEKGHYDKKEGAAVIPESGPAEVVISSHKRRPSKSDVQGNRVHSDTDKRGSSRNGRGGNGRGASRRNTSGDSSIKRLARAETKLVRKSRSGISTVESDNHSDERQVERKVQSRTNRAKPVGTRKPATSRQKTLRGSDKSRLRSASRLRRGRS